MQGSPILAFYACFALRRCHMETDRTNRQLGMDCLKQMVAVVTFLLPPYLLGRILTEGFYLFDKHGCNQESWYFVEVLTNNTIGIVGVFFILHCFLFFLTKRNMPLVFDFVWAQRSGELVSDFKNQARQLLGREEADAVLCRRLDLKLGLKQIGVWFAIIMITKMMLMVGMFLFAHPFGILANYLSLMFKSTNTGYQILVYLIAIIAACGQCYLMDRIFIDAYMNTVENKWYMKRLDEETERLRKERNQHTGELNEAKKKSCRTREAAFGSSRSNYQAERGKG